MGMDTRIEHVASHWNGAFQQAYGYIIGCNAPARSGPEKKKEEVPGVQSRRQYDIWVWVKLGYPNNQMVVVIYYIILRNTKNKHGLKSVVPQISNVDPSPFGAFALFRWDGSLNHRCQDGRTCQPPNALSTGEKMFWSFRSASGCTHCLVRVDCYC